MSRVVLRCEACTATDDIDVTHTSCPRCGGLYEVEHPLPPQDIEDLRRSFDTVATWTPPWRASGVWRYRAIIHPDAEEPVSWPEGNTPLVQHHAVTAWCGRDELLLKHEGMNPTGSFKDRGMTVAVTQARRIAASAVGCASTGNTSASLAAYAARAGLPALVFVPAGQIAMGKLTQSLAYGAQTLVVRGDFDDCLRLARDASRELGVYLVNSINPWRLEGQKSIVLELIQQLGWEPPDWIALPAGNLGNTAAFAKALREAFTWGLIRRLPKLLLVQAAGAAPFHAAFRDDFSTRRAVKAETVATAIKIGDPASWDRAVAAVRMTRGVVTSVTDDEILEAKAVVDAAGIGCEPASAASVAGVRQLTKEGVITTGDRVVAVLTGHVLKDPGTLLDYHCGDGPPKPLANPPVEIDGSLAAVERVLRRVQ